jgi:Tol biopolymer transport system component
MEASEHTPAWSSDGSQIAFHSNLMDGEGDIWMMPASGEPETRLTTNPWIDSNPAWSPVGAQIAFYSRRVFGPTYDYDIWVLTVGGGEQRLTSFSGQEFSPAWAPDGTQIAFASNRTDGLNLRLYVMPATGEPPATALTLSGAFHSSSPAWSPDGTQIAFVSDRAGTQDLWLMPATGEPAIPLTDYPSDERNPTWSPDGTWIAFSRHNGFDGDIWAIPSAGGQPVQITTDPAKDATPAWSPDGTRIAFASDRNGNPGRYDIWVLELPTSGLESAAVGPQAVRLAVSPNPFRDTATIHLGGAESGSSLRILNVAGRLVRQIALPAGAWSGTRTVVWDGRDAEGQPVAGGVYYLRLEGVNHAAGRAIRVQ